MGKSRQTPKPRRQGSTILVVGCSFAQLLIAGQWYSPANRPHLEMGVARRRAWVLEGLTYPFGMVSDPVSFS